MDRLLYSSGSLTVGPGYVPSAEHPGFEEDEEVEEGFYTIPDTFCTSREAGG
jgi:hypothetical protein